MRFRIHVSLLRWHDYIEFSGFFNHFSVKISGSFHEHDTFNVRRPIDHRYNYTPVCILMRLLFAVNEKTPVFPRHKKIGEPYLRFRISMARYRRSIASGDQRSHHCGNAVTINETVIISHLLFNRITVKISSAGMICIPHCRLCRCQLKNTICKTLQISMVTAFVFSPRPRCAKMFRLRIPFTYVDVKMTDTDPVHQNTINVPELFHQ